MDDELRRTVEAILFASGKRVEFEQIVKLCRRSPDDVLAVLRDLKSELDEKNSPTMLVEDGTGWKLTVREKYLSVIKRVVSKTELPKSILETLAVVAYKAPVLQSKVVKIRTNKAYDHLNYLESIQLISREKQGRTKLIRLTPKFFEYFDIDPSQLRKKFGNARDVEKAIEQKEKEIEDQEVAQKKQVGENLGAAQIVMGGEPLETYNASVDIEPSLPPGVEFAEDKVGELEVYQSDVEEKPRKKHHKKKAKHKDESEEVDEEVKEELVEEAEKETSEVEEPVEEKIEVEEVLEEKPKKKSHKKEEVSEEVKEEIKDVKEESEKEVKEVVKEEVVEVDKFSQEAISEAAQKKAQKLKSKEGKGLFPKGVPPEVEAKIEERIGKLLRGEDDESETPSSENQEEKKE